MTKNKIPVTGLNRVHVLPGCKHIFLYFLFAGRRSIIFALAYVCLLSHYVGHFDDLISVCWFFLIALIREWDWKYWKRMSFYLTLRWQISNNYWRISSWWNFSCRYFWWLARKIPCFSFGIPIGFTMLCWGNIMKLAVSW